MVSNNFPNQHSPNGDWQATIDEKLASVVVSTLIATYSEAQLRLVLEGLGDHLVKLDLENDPEWFGNHPENDDL